MVTSGELLWCSALEPAYKFHWSLECCAPDSISGTMYLVNKLAVICYGLGVLKSTPKLFIYKHNYVVHNGNIQCRCLCADYYYIKNCYNICVFFILIVCILQNNIWNVKRKKLLKELHIYRINLCDHLEILLAYNTFFHAKV